MKKSKKFFGWVAGEKQAFIFLSGSFIINMIVRNHSMIASLRAGRLDGVKRKRGCFGYDGRIYHPPCENY